MSAASALAADSGPRPAGAGVGWGPARAIALRALRDARVRTISFASLFALYAYIQPIGYRHAYPTLSERLAFAHSFADNAALRLFYGYPYDPVTPGGYSAWRVGGSLAIVAAVFGVLAAVRALRAEEEAGRVELVLAGVLGRRTAFFSPIAAIALGTFALGLAEALGFLAGGLSPGGSLYLALATASVVPVFVGVGALCSQLAPTRRVALELGSAVVALSLLARVIADTSSGAGWLRWTTPLGWAEQLRPFAGARPAVLLLPAAASVVLLVITARIAARRDIGSGVLDVFTERENASARLRLLSSPTARALRGERASLVVWLATVGAFAFILGMVSDSVSSAHISPGVKRQFARLGAGSILTPSGYLSFVFIFFVLAVSLFACAQVGAARHEEADEQLEALLSLPVSRVRWLGGRLALAGGAAAAIALAAGLFAWAGARTQGADVSLAQLIEAGANCLPAALLFLGIAALAYSLVPRAGAGIAYGLVTVAFLWQLTSSLLGAPRWLVDLTPFAHVGLVPAQPFKGGAALVMLALAGLAMIASLRIFARRDLVGR